MSAEIWTFQCGWVKPKLSFSANQKKYYVNNTIGTNQDSQWKKKIIQPVPPSGGYKHNWLV